MSPNHNLSYATRVSPATIQWLIANYETAEGVSLPRSTLYNHYLKHCNESKQDPVNAASFGKLIRSVFLGLRTRRFVDIITKLVYSYVQYNCIMQDWHQR